MSNWDNLEEFRSFLQLFGTGSLRPCVHILRNPLILGDWLKPEEEQRSWRAATRLWTQGARHNAPGFPDVRNGVLIYSSSDKPSVQPALSWLAQRLGANDVPTVHWGPGKITSFAIPHADAVPSPNSHSKDAPPDNETHHARFPHPNPPPEGEGANESLREFHVKEIRLALEQGGALSDIPACLACAAGAYLRAKLNSGPVAARLAMRPRRLFAETVLIRHAVHTMMKLLKRISPNLIITNGEQTAIGLALTAAARRLGIRVVWFFNEWPTHQMLPILSDELWVWNNTVAEALGALQPNPAPLPHIEVIGLAQLDCMEEMAKRGEVAQAALPGEKCLLFLSEYIPAYAHHSGTATETAFAWLAELATTMPDWHIVIKPRPYHTNAPFPGEHRLAGLSNIHILRDGATMAELFASPQVKAMAALSSSGLLLAAATGKMAFRLAVAGEPYPLPPLDKTVRRVNSPAELAKALGACEAPAIQPGLFPHRGQVIDRMLALCLQRLQGRLPGAGA